MTKTGRVPLLMQHISKPRLQLHHNDAKARGIQEGDFVRVTSRRGENIVSVQIDRDIREGVAFLPMHWGKMTAKSGCANTLIQSVTDPVSQEPEFKHSAVQVEVFKPAWRGKIFIAGEKQALGRTIIQDYTYGVVACSGDKHAVTEIALASTKPLKGEAYNHWDKIDTLIEQGEHLKTLTYADSEHAINYKAWIDEGHLVAVRLIGGNLHEADSLRALMLEDKEVSDLLPHLLTPAGILGVKEDAKGDIICACKSVGIVELQKEIQEGAKTLDKLKSCTKAGIICGSCIPEMKQLLTLI